MRLRHVQGPEQRAAHPVGRAGQQLQRAPHRRGERTGPRDDGIAHGFRQRRVRLGEDLADEERVAGRAGVHAGRVEAVPADELRNGRPAQRGELQPPRVRRADEVAQHRAQRVRGPDGVPVGQHEQQRQSGDAAGEEPDEVERGLVAPVQVFDDEGTGPAAQCLEHGGEDLVLGHRLPQHGRHRGADLAGDVAERAERAGSAQGVAHAPQHRHRRLLDELPQQDGLADARLPGDEHHRAAAVHGAAGSVAEHVKGMVALQQPHHGSSLGRGADQGQGVGAAHQRGATRPATSHPGVRGHAASDPRPSPSPRPTRAIPPAAGPWALTNPWTCRL